MMMPRLVSPGWHVWICHIDTQLLGENPGETYYILYSPRCRILLAHGLILPWIANKAHWGIFDPFIGQNDAIDGLYYCANKFGSRLVNIQVEDGFLLLFLGLLPAIQKLKILLFM